MAGPLSCPQGHSWHPTDARPEPGAAERLRCPFCGADALTAVDAGVPPASSHAPTLPLRKRGHSAQETPPSVLAPLPPPSHLGGSLLPRPFPLTWPTVPGYEVLGELGRGGMGVVYKARQTALDRTVALKMIAVSCPEDDPDLLRRFRREAEAVARLQHPNIIQVYEIGLCPAGPYLTMEYADWGSLADHWAGRPQAPRRVAALTATLARAVHAAHQRGVVHRDVKPANVLLSFGRGSEDPAPGAGSSEPRPNGGVPKISDFGLARRLDEAGGLTLSGQVMGTPGYMAPEQAQGTADAFGPAVDLYALGVLLYEGLTGRPPYRGMTSVETVHLMLSHEPVPPSRLRPNLPRDLEIICLHCLHKDPQRRYASAAALADDLDRYLAGRPIQARPTPAWERAWKWARRQPGTAALAAAVVAVTMLAFALITWQWRRAEAEQDRSERERHRAVRIAADEARARREAQVFSTQLLLERSISLCDAGPTGAGLLWLARSLESAPGDDGELRRSLRTLLTGWGRQLHPVRQVFPHPKDVQALVLSPNGRTLLTASGNRAYRWDARTGRQLGQPLEHANKVEAVAFSPDGRQILTGSKDNTARLWDAITGEPHGQPLRHQAPVITVAFSPDGRNVLTASKDSTARLWDAVTTEPRGQPLRHQAAIRVARFSPDGKRVATGSNDGTARLWDSCTGSAQGEPLRHQGPVQALAFSPDGSHLLTGSQDRLARLWQPATAQLVRTFQEHSAPVVGVAFSPDGKTIATGSEDHRALLWDAAGGAIKFKLQHQHRVKALLFSPDGRLVATASEDHTARIWSVQTGQPLGIALQHQGEVDQLAFLPDGRSLVTGGEDGVARLWELGGPWDQGLRGAASERLAVGLPHPGSVVALDVSPNEVPAGERGRLVLTGCSDGRLRLWEPASGRVQTFPLESTAMHAAFSPDGKRFVTAGWNGKVCVWETATGLLAAPPLVHKAPVRVAIFSPDSKYVLTGCEDEDKVVRLWDWAAGQEIQTFTGHTRKVSSLAFSRDGRLVLTGSWDKSARLWDARTGELIGNPLPHQDIVQAVAFSPDDRTLLTAGDDYTARLWDAETRQPRGLPLRHPDKVNGIAFSPDGRLVATGSRDKTARLWDVTTGKPVGTPLYHPGEVYRVVFTPDGKHLAAGCWVSRDTPGQGGAVQLWPVPQPLEGDESDLGLWLQVHTGLELDASGAVHVQKRDAWLLSWRTLQARP